MFSEYFGLAAILTAGMLLSVFLKKLTVPAAVAGGILSLLIFMGAGYTGITMMAAFFLLGTAATSWKIKAKQQLGLAEINKGKRTAVQVIANAGVAAILGLLVWLFPQHRNILSVMLAAVFSSATADTLSSELGNIYGSKYYNIITFKKDQRGLDGVISMEGTVIGLAGSIIISVIYATSTGCSIANTFIIIFAGTAGNLADSVAGATVQRRQLLNNDAVNFVNTCIAAITALLLHLLYSKR